MSIPQLVNRIVFMENPDSKENRRSFIKKSVLGSISLSSPAFLSGIVRADGGGTQQTTYDPWGTTYPQTTFITTAAPPQLKIHCQAFGANDVKKSSKQAQVSWLDSDGPTHGTTGKNYILIIEPMLTLTVETPNAPQAPNNPVWKLTDVHLINIKVQEDFMVKISAVSENPDLNVATDWMTPEAFDSTYFIPQDGKPLRERVSPAPAGILKHERTASIQKSVVNGQVNTDWKKIDGQPYTGPDEQVDKGIAIEIDWVNDELKITFEAEDMFNDISNGFGIDFPDNTWQKEPLFAQAWF